MQRHHITDTILDINTILTLPDSPPDAFLLSIDWSKIYDRVSHHWLDHILDKALFPLSFHHLVHTTYHHQHTSISINGFIGSSFWVSRGIPQGDPFAPFLFNLSIEPLFNALRSASIMVRAYADDIYLYGHDNSSWDPIAFWFHQYYLTTNGTVNWGKSKVIPLNPSRYTPHPSAPPAHSGPINTLGFILPLTTTNITSLWQSLINKITPITKSLATHSLSFRGRVLVAKSLVLSRIWYHASIAPPTRPFRKQIRSLLMQLIWHNSNSHPPTDTTATLPLTLGGISFPDLDVEFDIRAAKLMTTFFNPNPPCWARMLNQITRLSYNRSISHLTVSPQGTTLPLEPRRSGLNACKRIWDISSTILLSDPSLPQLRSLLAYSPLTPILPSPSHPPLSPSTWQEIFHVHRPRKVSDIMWRIAHNNIPTGIRVAAISPDGPHCPWCPSTLNSTQHLFATCPITTQAWTWADNTARLLTNLLSPLTSLISHSRSATRKRIRRLIQSAVIHTIWNAHTDRAFGHKATPSLTNFRLLYISTIISYRCIDIARYPRAPWPPISSLSSI